VKGQFTELTESTIGGNDMTVLFFFLLLRIMKKLQFSFSFFYEPDRYFARRDYCEIPDVSAKLKNSFLNFNSPLVGTQQVKIISSVTLFIISRSGKIP
jgi:hypothetical protein